MRRIGVAIVDSGANVKHEYLRENIYGGISIYSRKGEILYKQDYNDQYGHGTACCSVIKSECPDVSLFIVKILDTEGKANLLVFEKALEYLLNMDVQIISLSLSVISKSSFGKLAMLCRTITDQGKIIVCSLENKQTKSFPAVLRCVIGVKGYILENDNAIWYNEKKKIQCVVDSNSHLHCDLSNGYRLFGKSNSYAAAKLAGRIANFMSCTPSANSNDVNDYLKKEACREHWNRLNFRKSKRYPDYGCVKNIKNIEILNKIINIVSSQLNVNKEMLYVYSLFDYKIGLTDEGCYTLICKIEHEIGVKFDDYTKISRYDFFSIYRIANLFEKLL